MSVASVWGLVIDLGKVICRFQCRGQNSIFKLSTSTLWRKNGGDSLMLQRLQEHTTLTMTNCYCQAVGCYDAMEAHERYSPVDRLHG